MIDNVKYLKKSETQQGLCITVQFQWSWGEGVMEACGFFPHQRGDTQTYLHAGKQTKELDRLKLNEIEDS